MPTEKRCSSVLIVSGKEQRAEQIRDMLQANIYRPVDMVFSINEAKRKTSRCEYDIMILDAPLPDEFGHEFAIDTASATRTGVILLVKNELYDRVTNKVEDYGVFTVAKPFTRQNFHMAVKFVTASSARLYQQEKKNRSLEMTIEEIRLVNQAKCILIEKRGMTEAEAHRCIGKMAMDNRQSKREVAQEIIDTVYDQAAL